MNKEIFDKYIDTIIAMCLDYKNGGIIQETFASNLEIVSKKLNTKNADEKKETDSFKREVSCFLVPEQKILSVTTNNTGAMVEFDFFTIWEQLKTMKYDSVCMIHTHPDGFDMMSGIDWNMVYGWVQAIGKPIYFVIVTKEKITCYLCERSKENKNKVNREKIECLHNLQGLAEILQMLSRKEEAPNEDYFLDMCKYINENDIFSIRKKDDSNRGLYRKFIVERVDGSKKHKNCEYFVLDLNHDKHAIAALKAYAESCKEEFPELAVDLEEKIKWMILNHNIN